MAGLCFVSDAVAAEPESSEVGDQPQSAQVDVPGADVSQGLTVEGEASGAREPESESAETPKLVFEVGDVPELKPPKLEVRRRQRRWFRMSVLPTRWRKMPHGWVVQLGDIGVRWASTTPRRSSIWADTRAEAASGERGPKPAAVPVGATSEFDPMQSSISPERLRRGRRASSGPSTSVVRGGN